MVDRPIIFSAPMVRALLEGRKTQTRRIVKDVPPQPEPDCHPKHQQRHPAPYLDSYCSNRRSQANPRGMSDWWSWWQVDDRCCLPQFRVPYVPGDRLWVRENWRQAYPKTDFSHGAVYRADAEKALGMDEYSQRHRWTPSIHMPRWASRITLHVTGVKVERLQDISEEDARAEGVSAGEGQMAGTYFVHGAGVMSGISAVSCFERLWHAIHGPDAWTANPWVVAITFRVVHANIDSPEAKAA